MTVIEELQRAVSYDPLTGLFRFKRVADFRPQWNARCAGKPALTGIHNGYHYGSVNKISFYAHRAAIMLMSGIVPDEVDHINGDKLDNRFENLRPVSRLINSQNMPIRTDNWSGFQGIYFSNDRGKWQAQINVAGKMISLGRFQTLEAAVEARKSAERTYGYHPNHGTRKAAVASDEKSSNASH